MRQMLKSLIYYLFLAALIFFYVSQVGSFTPYSEPLKGQEQSYGLKASSDKQEIMGATLAMLARGYEGNSYTAYPVGFYKNVVLTEEKQEEIPSDLNGLYRYGGWIYRSDPGVRWENTHRKWGSHPDDRCQSANPCPGRGSVLR